MAKVNGPLFSMDASGKFASTLVFTKWKGRPVVRQLVIPANPHSADQETARNIIRVCGAAQRFANLTELMYPAATALDKDALRDAAPSGQAWNGFLVKCMTGAAAVNYLAADALYDGDLSAVHSDWDDAAEALIPAFSAIKQTLEDGVLDTPMETGRAFCHYVYGLYIAGLATIPDVTPPAYA
jgi:hypothetical protein